MRPMTQGGWPVRVAIVDDDEIARRGIVSLLQERGDISVVAALSHVEADTPHFNWGGIDLVLVDAVDERRDDDQYPGVRIVETIRRARNGGAPTLVVTSSNYFDDALRRRMLEALPDFFHDRALLDGAASWHALVLRPRAVSAGVPPCTDPEAQFRLGVTQYSRVNDGVAFALRHRLRELIGARPDPRSRKWLHLRREFNDVARLYPVTSDGRTPDRTQDYPSLPQIARFLRWATRINEESPLVEQAWPGRPENAPVRLPAGSPPGRTRLARPAPIACGSGSR